MYQSVYLILTVLVMISCSGKNEHGGENGNKKVAEAYNKTLFIADIPGLSAASTQADSISVINGYARDWAKNEVFIRKAKDQLSVARQKQIDAKVDAYKLSLYRYEYEKSLITQKLDTTLDETELDSFVRQFPSNFILEEDIVRFNLIVNPPPADIAQMRRWIQSGADDELSEYCSRKKLEYYLGSSSWTPLAALYGMFPEAPVQKLPNNEIAYLAANGKRYLVQILDHKVHGSPAPTSFIRDEVKSALLQTKKAKFAEDTREQMLEDAIKKKKVKFYP